MSTLSLDPETHRGSRVFEAYASGVASVTVYDHHGYATLSGRYQIVKSRKMQNGRFRTSISYRHQRPAALRIARDFIALQGEVVVRYEAQEETR